jgi:putative MATE family efflux protein
MESVMNLEASLELEGGPYGEYQEPLHGVRPFLTVAPILPAIIQLSWPLVLNMMFLSLSNFVEGWIAGRLGVDCQSALGIGSQIWFFLMMLTLALSSGTIAVLSKYYGAGDVQSTANAARQALLLSAIFGSIAGAVSFFFARSILSLFGPPATVVEPASQYLKYASIAALPYTVLWISNSIFRAKGDSRTAMITMVIVTACTIILDLLFCFRPFALGLKGIGLSWLISSWIGIAFNFCMLKRSDLSECLRCSQDCLRLSRYWLGEFMKIGLPGCVQDLSLLLSSLGVFWILGHCLDPVANQAAWAAGWRVEETLIIMPMYGLNIAAATVIGQNLGAKQYDRAKLCGWYITIFGALISAVVAFVLFWAAPSIASLMTDDALVRSSCMSYLRTVAATWPFFASWLILSGCMQGAGFTRFPMVVTIFFFNIVRVAGAWFLSTQCAMEAQGVWIGMAGSTVAAALCMALLWRGDLWMRRQRESCSKSRIGDDDMRDTCQPVTVVSCLV